MDKRTRKLLRASTLEHSGFDPAQLSDEVIKRRGDLASTLTEELKDARGQRRRDATSCTVIAGLTLGGSAAIVLSDRPVLICSDELDKMADPDGAALLLRDLGSVRTAG